MPPPATPGLWDFSLSIYARPGVAPLCLALQAGHDADVNVVLCALWIGFTGRGRLNRGEIAALDAVVAPLRDAVVKPLRGARTWLKPRLVADPSLATLREAIKRVELESEHEEQRRLEQHAGARMRAVGSVADALANVTAYLVWRGADPRAAAELAPFAAALAEISTGTAQR
ncbi:MAG: TIGR02444 family protein [Alphaproteobacteria bacterium]|nr:TIGR02444 family protein [Alphaproteobacteria bacterium]